MKSEKSGKEKISFFKSIGGKITLISVIIVLLAIGVVTLLSILQSSDALMESWFKQLEAIREIKRDQLRLYTESKRSETAFIVETVEILEDRAFKELEAVHALKKENVERYFRTVNVTDELLAPGGPVHRRINTIVQNRVSMGKSGETYLMSEEDGRFFFRSDMTTMGNGAFVFGADQTEVALSVEYIQRAASGESGSEIFTDSAGRLVMVVFTPLDIDGRNWFMITKKDFEESISVKMEGRDEDIFYDYMNEFGYYDIFLIHPEGSVFYSVTHEADYGTNIIHGEFSDSGLGRVVRRVKETGTFGFADFSPYEPSGGVPAAFVAEPIMSGNAVKLIVAMQISLDQINAIMQERSGMGETGETYLVGPDKLMRSDSYLDPEYHSVTASFADPERGDVDTVAVREALKGNSDVRIISDYNGNSVLSAFAPMDVFGTTWAAIAEIDESEVRRPVNSLILFILASALAMILVAVVIAVFFSRTISRPLLTVVRGADLLAVGDIQVTGIDPAEIGRINRRGDELGRIGQSFTRLIEYQQEKVAVAREIAYKNLRVEVTVSSEKDSLGKAFSDMVDALNDMMLHVSEAVEQVSTGSDQVSQASSNLSQGATEQASSIEEISSSVTEINNQSRQNTAGAEEANKLSKKAADDANAGSEQMKDLVQAMAGITASSEEINKIVKTIDDIAFQINLLALNANIEAARAGTYGKGFAVVAEEVRNLANRSAESVHETSERVEEANRNIRLGNDLVEKTEKQLVDIVSGVEKIADLLDEIATASREQTAGIEQITEGLSQIEDVTQSNTAGAEESASSAEELASQAQQLREIITAFRLRGGNAGFLPAPGETPEDAG